MPHITDLPQPTTLLEVRAGKMAAFGPVRSGIDKQCRHEPTFVSFLGLTDDEHDPTFHGGIDKAVHQYCSSHYDQWHKLYPNQEQIDRFVTGGFGENLVAEGLSETNVCAGDLIRIGPAGSLDTGGTNGCLLEVSIPRQPCFKLNQRFGIKNFAPRTHQLAKTGWYYRVKEEGWISPGMEIRVVQRKHPRWTIAQLHHFVHKEKQYLPQMQELIDMPELGDECKGVFTGLYDKHCEEEKRKNSPPVRWQSYRLTKRVMETPRVVRLTFNAVSPIGKPARILPGSSAVIKLPNGLQRAYSIVEGTSHSISLGISRDAQSRGGSTYLHDSLKLGDTIEIGAISTNLKPSGMASYHIFVVGGIGITAFLSICSRFQATNQSFELHYCVRSAKDIAFSKELDGFGDQVTYYDSFKGQRLNIRKLLEGRRWNSHVFTCGPEKMIAEVVAAARELGMAEDEVRYEKFQADTTGDPFTVQVECRGQSRKLKVGEHESLLEVMRKAGLEVQSSCETGSCGTCRIPLLQGRVLHKGTALTAKEQEKEMLSCVSRGVGEIVVDVSEQASESGGLVPSSTG